MKARVLFFIFALLFFCSRIFFFNTQAVFFDSPEYIQRFEMTSYWQALTYGHVPLHSGYIFLFWPIYHLAMLLHVTPLTTVLFFQALLAWIVLVMLYQILFSFTRDRQISVFACIFWSLNPLFWLTNESIMMELTYLFFFVSGWWCIHKYLENSFQTKWVFFSVICLALAVLTHVFVILWLPLMCFFVFLKKPSAFPTVLAALGTGVLIGVALTIYLIQANLNSTLWAALQALAFSKLNEQSSVVWSLRGLLVFGRNAFIPLLRNNSVGLCILAVFGCIYALRKDWKMCVLLCLWIAPAVFVNQWWDSLWYGRHALIAGLGICLAASFFATKYRWLLAITVIYLLYLSVAAMVLLRFPIPDIQEAEAFKQLPANGLIIESHFARPQTQEQYAGQIVYVDEPGTDESSFPYLIHSYLQAGQPVFVTSQALSEPYGLYAGPYLHTLSLSYQKPYILQSLLHDFSFTPYMIVDQGAPLMIYTVNENPGNYPVIPVMRHSKRRFDAADPFVQLWWSTFD